jgi:hypothetical protein
VAKRERKWETGRESHATLIEQATIVHASSLPHRGVKPLLKSVAEKGLGTAESLVILGDNDRPP